MADKFQNWCDKLLDTGKGNRLINFKDVGFRTVEILAPGMDSVLKSLTTDKKMEFYDVDNFIRNYDQKSSTKKSDELEIAKVSKDEVCDTLIPLMDKKQILAYKNGYKLSKILSNLKKIAATSLTEKGINILYITFGFISWKDPSFPDMTFKSPLILVPIKLENKSKNTPFYISNYEDEIKINPTLQYKFKMDFGLDLPIFMSKGYEEETLDMYFARVEEFALKNNWSFSKESFIGTFSFLKLNMYMDLKENKDKMLLNPLVNKLVNNDKVSNKDMPEFDFDKLLNDDIELKLHNVVDADSSQLEAICAAKKGISFVLQGPPGTGKSQTIANLISEFLYDGKKVLFVSEKLAALNVVFSKLKKTKLSDFCLELHSNKSNKKEFIAELNRVLNEGKTILNSQTNDTIEDFKHIKNYLDDYADVLYKIQPLLNMSPYQILQKISKYQNAPSFEYVINNLKIKDINYLNKATEELEKFVKFEDHFGYDYRDNIWYGFRNTDLSFVSKINFKNALKKMLNDIISIKDTIFNFNQLFSDTAEINTIAEFLNIYNLLSTISKLKTFDGNYFNKDTLNKIRSEVSEINKNTTILIEKKSKIDKLFNSEIYTIDIDNYYNKFRDEYYSVFRGLNSNYKRDKHFVCSYLLNKKNLSYGKILKSLETVKDILKLNSDIEQDKVSFVSLLKNKEFKEYDFRKIEEDVTTLNSVMSASLDFLIGVDYSTFKSFQNDINAILSENKNLVNSEDNLNNLQEFFDLKIFDIKNTDLVELENRLQKCLDEIDDINNWFRLKECLDNLTKLDLFDFVEQSIINKIPRTTLVETYQKLFYSQWMYEVVASNKILRDFNRETQDEYVEEFKDKDKLGFKISQAQINESLSLSRPDIFSGVKGSQVNILIRENQKKSKQKPVRELLGEIGELIQELKPCFLMSPLSVSTYLDFDKCNFDVVIFDEASQIFPWDAIGAISRAKQVIVVGDSKQMPPTNFFNANLVDDEFYDEEGEIDDSLDFESILDLCVSTLGFVKSLKWHYRSKTEELITFSNRYFYDSKLITFPASHKNDLDMGVDFCFVENGIYDRKSRCNELEAERVVDLIYEHFEKHPDRSLGVVAFSISQQGKIEDAIFSRREKDDRFAKFFDENLSEPFFVKNLETVQGDERDTIIFSVGYAKGSDGKFIHNFGPLNKKGGERRLNVAITRAKYNVKLVSSIKSYDINLNNTKAEGAKLLKEYLQYAEQGIQDTFNPKELNSETLLNFDIEKDVYDVLTTAGYEVDMRVGCSEYKVDLAVKNPINNTYVLAIECDGESYHSGKTTRVRDRSRQEVLAMFGWKFYRIWSIEWFKNRNSEIKKLLEVVDKAIKNLPLKASKTNTSDNKRNNTFENLVEVKKDEPKDIKTLFKTYETYYPRSKKFPGFRNSALGIIKKEGPISEDLLMYRLAQVFRYKKITSSFVRTFKGNMKYIDGVKKIEDCYVLEGHENISMRVPAEGSEPRPIELISIVELGSGIIEIIKNNMGIKKEDLYKTLIKLLGFNRLNENIRLRLDEVLKFLLNNAKVKEVAETYFVGE